MTNAIKYPTDIQYVNVESSDVLVTISLCTSALVHLNPH